MWPINIVTKFCTGFVAVCFSVCCAHKAYIVNGNILQKRVLHNPLRPY